jgi:hypothetical protein
MSLLQHSGFQTVEFVLVVVLAVWVMLGRDIGWRFLGFWCLLGLLGLFGLNAWGERFPTLPFFVSFWRLAAIVVAASLLGEILSEWKHSAGGRGLAHALGIGLALGGAALAWRANWEVSSATLLLGSFLGLGYCVRENRTGS